MKLSHLLKVTLFFSIGLLALSPVRDFDIWYHLKTGEWISKHLSIPYHDPFSFTAGQKLWIAHEWLSQLMFYLVYRLLAIPGIIVMKAFLIMTTFYFVYLRCRKLGAHLHFTVAFVFWGALLSAGSFTERPHLFSFLLTALLLFLFECKVSPTAFFFIGLLWVNLHSSFILLPVLLAAHGIIAKKRFPWLALMLGIAGACANPHGIYMFIYPLTVALNPAHTENILEWFSPNFHLPQMWLLEALLFFPLFLLRKRIQASLFFLFLFVFFGHLALQSVRHIPLLAVAVTPYMAAYATQAFPSSRGTDRRSILHACFLALYAVLLVAVAPKGKADEDFLSKKDFPIKAVEYLQRHSLGSNLLALYEWGGYCIFKLYPDYKIFIDGRADLYAEEILPKYLKLFQTAEGFEKILFSYRVQTVLFPRDSLLVRELRKLGWTLRYADKKAAVLTAPTAKPAELAHFLTAE